MTDSSDWLLCVYVTDPLFTHSAMSAPASNPPVVVVESANGNAPPSLTPVILHLPHSTYAVVEGPVAFDAWLLAHLIAENSLHLNGYSWPVMLTPVGERKEHFSPLRLVSMYGIMVADASGGAQLWYATRFPSGGHDDEDRARIWAMMCALWPDKHMR
jgi:hypothetical protein